MNTEIIDNGDGTLTITETQTIVTQRIVDAIAYKEQLEAQRTSIEELRTQQLADIDNVLVKIADVMA